MKFVKQYWPGLLIILTFLIIGLCNYQDYGASTDELGQHAIGETSYKYVFEGDTSLHSFYDRDHGVGFELPLIIIEKKLGATDYRDLFLARHLVAHLFFLLCMLSGYFLACKLFKNQLIACATLIMLILDPRLYAHSFFNSKDMPSLAALVLILSAAYTAFERRKPLSYLLLGMACGYATSIRLMNIVILAPLLVFGIIDILRNFNDKSLLKRYTIGFLLLSAGFAITLYVCWPLLWEHPIDALIESFVSMSKFRWQGEVFFGGKYYDASALPWSYVPTWFFVTVPEVWLFLGIAGMIFILADFLKAPLTYFDNNEKRPMALYLYSFVVPIIAVVVLQSILYDDWRHLFFIYPAFILMAGYAMHELFKTKFKILYQSLWLIQLVAVIFFIVNNHPHEYIYFNHTVSRKKDNLMKKYELDYWGLSNIKGLEWILEHSNDDSIYINNLHNNYLNTLMMTPDKRPRFILTNDESKLEYYIENFRLYPFKYPEDKAAFQITVSNSPILRVTKLK